MSAAVSIYDVAKEAGVSESTVSRAFSRPELVSSKTRAKVLETARRMNFSLDRGRGGSTGRTHRIALVQNGDVASWYPGLVFSGLNSVFRPAGYDLAIYDVVDTRRLHEFLASIPDRRNVDAVVVVSFDVEPKETETLHELGIPVVGVGTAMHRETGMDAWTSVDNAQGMKLMIRYLASLGHRRIMYVGHDPESFELPFSTLARLKGFRQACEQAGVEGRTLPIPFGDWRFDVTFSILLDDESIPTALVCQQRHRDPADTASARLRAARPGGPVHHRLRRRPVRRDVRPDHDPAEPEADRGERRAQGAGPPRRQDARRAVHCRPARAHHPFVHQGGRAGRRMTGFSGTLGRRPAVTSTVGFPVFPGCAALTPRGRAP